MSTRLAKIAESRNVDMRDDIELDSAKGLLPAYCDRCTGFLDFVRVNNKTVLKCRECGKVLDI